MSIEKALDPTVAVFTFSADPITLGHIYIIERASMVFHKVYVAVLSDSSKKYLFSLEERLALVEKDLFHLMNVEVVTNHEVRFTSRFVESLGAKVIVRGIRDAKDLEFEQNLEFFNSNISPDIQTFFVITPPHLRFVSSSNARAIDHRMDESWADEVSRLVTPETLEAMIQKNVILRFQKHWEWLMKRLDNPTNTKEVFSEIVEAYQGQDRHYHNLLHIVEVLDELMEVIDLLNKPEVTFWAGIIHDLVYETDFRDFTITDQNEVRSSELGARLAEKLNAPLLINNELQVLDRVMAITHKFISKNNDAKFLADADISILGKTKRRFEDYCEGVRKEYAWVDSDLTYCTVRAKFLDDNFLSRDYVFSTVYFINKYNEKAINNVSKHVWQLRSQADTIMDMQYEHDKKLMEKR